MNSSPGQHRPPVWQPWKGTQDVGIRVEFIRLCWYTGEYFKEVGGEPANEVYILVDYVAKRYGYSTSMAHVVIKSDLSQYAHVELTDYVNGKEGVYEGKHTYKEYKLTFQDREKIRKKLTNLLMKV